MATSGSYDFTLDRDKIINAALRKCGVIATGQTATASQIEFGSEALNVMVKAWQTRGVYLWTREWVNESLAASTAFFTVAADTLDIDRAVIRDSDGNDTPVTIIPMTEYLDLADKDAEGKPHTISLHKKLTPTVYLYPEPDVATYTLQYLRVRKLEDFDAGANTADFPEKWLGALVWGLADELGPEYQVPEPRQRRLEKKAKESFAEAKGDDVETVTSLRVRPRLGRR